MQKIKYMSEESLNKTGGLDTEEKIKEAARTIFHQKGYAATRTRDIAEAAGVNLALLNYYFRSKEKLFNIIMSETLGRFMEKIRLIFNDPGSTLEEKIGMITNQYIDLLIDEPEIPLFIISEVRTNPELLLEKLPIRDLIFRTIFYKQFQQAVAERRIDAIHPIHYLMNMIGLIIMPALAKPILQSAFHMNGDAYKELMENRKQLIPRWLYTIHLNSNQSDNEK